MPPIPIPPGEPLFPAPLLIVEDEPHMQRRISAILSGLGYPDDAICVAGSLAQGRRLISEMPFAVALVDLRLPDGNGLDLIAELRLSDPTVNILVISAWSTRDTLLSALRAGANGYVLKERDDLEVSLAIRSTLQGGAAIDPFIARQIILELPLPAGGTTTDAAPHALSSREHEILRLVADGLTNREIAQHLHLSRYTVECHVKHIYRKLAVSSRTRAVNEARSRGLLD